MDPDEYFVPMGRYTNWKEILDRIDREEGLKILKFRSTRARPVLHLLTWVSWHITTIYYSVISIAIVDFPHFVSEPRPTYDEGVKECTHVMAKQHNNCLTKRDDKTYLETYNCEYIKSPKPERFARAMVSFIVCARMIKYLSTLLTHGVARNNFIAPILWYRISCTTARLLWVFSFMKSDQCEYFSNFILPLDDM